MVTKKTTTKKAPVKKAPAGKTKVKCTTETAHIGLVRDDAYLAPYEDAIRGRHEHALWKMNELTQHGKQTLSDFANGHDYYGLHQMAGCSVNGHRMQRRFTLSVTSMTGRRRSPICVIGSKGQETGNSPFRARRCSTDSSIRCGYTGRVEKANGFRPGRSVSYRTRRARYSPHRYGLLRNHTSGRKRPSGPRLLPC